MSLTLHGFGPTRAARCLWTLRELGLDFDEVTVDLPSGAHRSPEFLALNPWGKVPVLQDGDLTVFESVAICLYLADKHPERGLVPPPGTPERALHDQWLLFTVTELDAPLWRLRRNKILRPPAQRLAADIPLAAQDFREAAAVVQEHLEGREFVGERFQVADIVLAHTLFWSTWNDLLEGLPGLQAWLATQRARPACPEVMRP